MTFASIEDTRSIEQKMSWAERDVPKTIYALLSDTARKYPDNNAVSFQILSGATDKAETLNWRVLHEKITLDGKYVSQSWDRL